MATNSSPHRLNDAHRTLLRLTRGRFGWHAYGMPMLELTTIGRTSGEKRTTMLSSPLVLGDSLVIVASRGGDDRHPSWYLNILESSDVTVNFQGAGARPMHARPATADERAEWWPVITKDHANYAGYQRKTEREIPLVLLEPV